jgi:putative transposase
VGVTLARSTRLHVAPIASTAVSRPTSEPEDFLRPKTLAAKTVAPLGAHAALLSQGTYLCSVRTMYRILAQNKAIRERRRIASHSQAKVPRLRATRLNQVWTWDITKLPAALGGYYNLYAILDLYSRCVVGWRLVRSKTGALAAMFVRETILANGVDPDGLSIRADRGAAMTSRHLSQWLSKMNITQSHSRPRTSNDNAYSES